MIFSGIRTLIGKREKVEFAQTVQRYDRKFRGLKTAKRDLIVTQKGIFIIGREPVKTGPNKGQIQESVSRNIPFQHLFQVSPRFFKELVQIGKIFFWIFFYTLSLVFKNLDFFGIFLSGKTPGKNTIFFL